MRWSAKKELFRDVLSLPFIGERVGSRDSVTEIGSYAFSGCSNLQTVYYGGSESDWEKVSGKAEISYRVTIVYNAK